MHRLHSWERREESDPWRDEPEAVAQPRSTMKTTAAYMILLSCTAWCAHHPALATVPAAPATEPTTPSGTGADSARPKVDRKLRDPNWKSSPRKSRVEPSQARAKSAEPVGVSTFGGLNTTTRELSAVETQRVVETVEILGTAGIVELGTAETAETPGFFLAARPSDSGVEVMIHISIHISLHIDTRVSVHTVTRVSVHMVTRASTYNRAQVRDASSSTSAGASMAIAIGMGMCTDIQACVQS